jgi:hypothetical protein
LTLAFLLWVAVWVAVVLALSALVFGRRDL